MSGGDHFHGVEPGVEELDHIGSLFGDPVGSGEADVTRAQREHLDDVLRLEELELETIGGGHGSVSAWAAGPEPNSGIGKQRRDGALGSSLGDYQVNGPGLDCQAGHRWPFLPGGEIEFPRKRKTPTFPVGDSLECSA